MIAMIPVRAGAQMPARPRIGALLGVSSTTITETSTVETKWIVMSQGLPGELIKMSSHALG